ncbi:hypothetical protein KKD34_02990, partial [bacterium]|nr:hypothetical protein [bacterium]
MEEREERIIRKISIGILLAIFLIGLGLIGFFLFAIIPTFVTMFAEVGILLPLPTRIMVGISSALRSYWYFTSLPIGIVLIFAIWWIRKALFRSPIWLPILLIPVFVVLLGLV